MSKHGWTKHYSDFQPVAWGDLRRVIHELKEHMASQTDIDALAAQVDQVSADLTTAVEEVQAELDSLSQANPNLDLSSLSDKVSQLDAQAQAVGSLVPAASASSGTTDPSSGGGATVDPTTGNVTSGGDTGQAPDTGQTQGAEGGGASPDPNAPGPQAS